MYDRKLKIMFVCRAGKDRSKTAAEIVTGMLTHVEVRHGGVDAEAKTPVQDEDLLWADMIVCMENYQRGKLRRRRKGLSHKITVWNIRDEYLYRDPALVAEISARIHLLLER